MSFPFVHLRVHSEYSLVDGLVKVKPLIKAVGEGGMPAVAVTDQNNMCSLIKFYKAAMGAGVKPISGVDIWVVGRDDDANLSRMTLLSMNRAGYRNLTELISRGYTEGQRNGLVTIRREWIAEASDGVIALSGAKEGRWAWRCCPIIPRKRIGSSISGWAYSPVASISSCSAPADVTTKNICMPPWPWLRVWIAR